MHACVYIIYIYICIFIDTRIRNIDDNMIQT